MKRDELLTKLAMELAEWCDFVTPQFEMPHPWCWAIVGDGAIYARKSKLEFIFRCHWLDRRTELINKPSWSDAPEWAEWLTQGPSGKWYWAEGEKPVEIPGLGGWAVEPFSFSIASVGTIPAGHNWRDTLERRPTAEPDVTPEEDEAFSALAANISDGSTASYYELPEDATELQDLISYRNMNAQIGELFRAAYRYGLASHSEKMRDAKKIKFYIESEIDRLEKYER